MDEERRKGMKYVRFSEKELGLIVWYLGVIKHLLKLKNKMGGLEGKKLVSGRIKMQEIIILEGIQ